MTDAQIQAVQVGFAAPLGKVASLSALRAEVCHQLDDAVIAARAAGASWSDVGRAAGMTRQAAHERWAAGAANLSSRDGEG